ncbi:MAG: hypothetical protein U5M51_12995 [Emticicia sp.]|nr:hypothetical protein [Emticicia sp.]
MKKNILPMNILLISALLLGGCKANDPIATPMPTADYSIVNGDTIKTVIFKDYKKLKDKDPNSKNYIVVGDTIVLYKEPKLHTPPAKDPDLSKLKNNDDPDLKGKPLRMVAIGGSLTAGVRDGGYFNEGILTSYPNLIARQMKLKKFEQPLFDATDYNGFGRKVRTSFNPTGGPVPKFNEVKNNSGVESVDELGINGEKGIKLKKAKNRETLDNFSLAYGPSRQLYTWGSTNPTNQSSDIKYAIFSRLTDKELIPQGLFKNKFDFFILETGLNDILVSMTEYYQHNYTTKPEMIGKSFEQLQIKDLNSYQAYLFDLSATYALIAESNRRKVKYGCILNTPDIFEFPYFKFVTGKMIDDVFAQAGIYHRELDGNVYSPNSRIDSLLSSKVHIALKPGINTKYPILRFGVNDNSYKNLLSDFNTEKESLSKRFGYPIVDINSLYKKILAGEFTTTDGVKVNPSWVDGNFFSSDGIYPSAFGQAVIANEVIKVLNSTYKTDIPLISTKEYLNR